jgi:dTDP-4-dehydrorhamnose 3,5-epimerase
MRIISVTPLAIPECKVIRYHSFQDDRGYFTEHYRREEFDRLFKQVLGYPYARFLQANESCSKARVVRGLHFQWSPYVGKLVRTLYGRMVDMMLDIRIGSPTLGKIILYDMPHDPDSGYGEWIWVPPGFAHGNFYPENSAIEYFCTGEYNPATEAGISPFAPDIDWSLAKSGPLKADFEEIFLDGAVLSEKDRNGHTVASWLKDPHASEFAMVKRP